MMRDQRRRVEGIIERLIAMLDTIDGDRDFEPDNDNEPSLGWTERGCFSFRCGGDDDREQEDEHDEDGGDAEPDADDEEECAAV